VTQEPARCRAIVARRLVDGQFLMYARVMVYAWWPLGFTPGDSVVTSPTSGTEERYFSLSPDDGLAHTDNHGYQYFLWKPEIFGEAVSGRRRPANYTGSVRRLVTKSGGCPFSASQQRWCWGYGAPRPDRERALMPPDERQMCKG